MKNIKQFFKYVLKIIIPSLDIRFYIGKILFEMGWFGGEEFILFDFKIFEKIEGISITLVRLQIAKFCISLYYESID